MQAILRTAFPPALPKRGARPFPWPWRDRAGRFSALRAVTLALILAPGAWLLVTALTEGLGPEPAKAALREIGLWTIRLLLVTLAVTPLGRILAAPRVLGLRRMLGLATLAYALLHLLLYAVDQNFGLPRIASEIALRFYLTIGFVALLGLAVLGWTSTDGWMRQLGLRWKRLHFLIFPIAALGVFHFFLQSKSQLWEAVLAAGLLAWLVLWRLLPAGARLHPVALMLLAPASGLAAAGVEYAWYALATSLPASRILAANLDIAFGLRPAVWAAVAAVVPPLLALPGWIRARQSRRTAPGSAAPGPEPAHSPAAAGNPGR
ncbi:ferric reductase-like transmembrane domain-containing protein [Belnapia sp. T6]|uniref:Protein-methionine-sulfoxide reductase heme-binding subunit MsrQ n=2 Tax=Belnapia mucosa TaxID=2804532 RepID=A0ABS1V678_9PROT|nr:ferric reductase-like transmembrane domain-containing protein [Belnapia mucosa]